MHCNNHHPLSKEHMKKNRKTEKRKRERDGADISKMREIFLKADNSEKKQRSKCSQDKKISRQRKEKKISQTRHGNVMTPNKKNHSPEKIPKHKRSFPPEEVERERERERSKLNHRGRSKQATKKRTGGDLSSPHFSSHQNRNRYRGRQKSIFTTPHPSTQASSSSATSFSPAAFALPQRVSSVSAPVASFVLALVLALAFHSPWT